MSALKLFHNPRCSKSRQALALLRERGAEPEVVLYLEAPPDRASLLRLIRSSESEPVAFVRRGDAAFQEAALELADDAGAEAVADLLARHPKLLQRPLLTSGKRTVIGRPPEAVLELL